MLEAAKRQTPGPQGRNPDHSALPRRGFLPLQFARDTGLKFYLAFLLNGQERKNEGLIAPRLLVPWFAG